jgi:Arc/MetJ family transcription regulator
MYPGVQEGDRRHIAPRMCKHFSVRITVDLDADLLSAVEERRTACKTTGEVLADLARQALRISPSDDITAYSALRGSSVRREDEDRAHSLS